MCAIPVHIYFTRTVQPEPMALWGLLGFLYYADLWLYRFGGSKAWILAVLLGALAPLLKLPFLYVLFPLWAYLGYECFGTAAFRKGKWLIMMGLILVMTEAWYHYAKTAPVTILPLHLSRASGEFGAGIYLSFMASSVCLAHSRDCLHLLRNSLYRYRNLLLPEGQIIQILSRLVGDLRRIRCPFRRVRADSSLYASCPWRLCQLFGSPAALPLSGSMRNRFLLDAYWRLILIVGIPVHAALRIAHWYRLDYPYLTRAHLAMLSISRPNDLVLVASHEKPELLYYMDRYGYAIDPASWKPAGRGSNDCSRRAIYFYSAGG